MAIHYIYAMCVHLYISYADSFAERDAFVGYQSDTPAAIVLKVWQDLKLVDAEFSDQMEEKVDVIYVCTYSISSYICTYIHKHIPYSKKH